MRDKFHGYYEPTKAEFEKMWDHGLLVPDTNVLFHLFRFMPKQRDEVQAAFKSFGDRLWLPHQVAKEFLDGWRSADRSNRGAYSRLKDDLAKKKGEVEVLIRGFSRFDPWPEGSSMNQIAEFFEDLSTEVDTATANLANADDVFAAVTDLFNGKVAEQPEQKHIEMRLKEAERRIQSRIPPGYMDKRPGDYLIWAEMKEKAKNAELPMLFVTGDVKEDWWLEQSGRTIGPRPELRQEFTAETGQMFYAYAPARFLALLAERTKNLVSPETVKEMERAELAEPQELSWTERASSLAQKTHLDPFSVHHLAHRIAQATATTELTANLPNRGGPSAAWLRDQLIKWREEAESLFNFPGEGAENRESSSTWNEFLTLVDDMTLNERYRLSQLAAPKRARF
jgi:hypothetical protein